MVRQLNIQYRGKRGSVWLAERPAAASVWRATWQIATWILKRFCVTPRGNRKTPLLNTVSCYQRHTCTTWKHMQTRVHTLTRILTRLEWTHILVKLYLELRNWIHIHLHCKCECTLLVKKWMAAPFKLATYSMNMCWHYSGVMFEWENEKWCFKKWVWEQFDRWGLQDSEDLNHTFWETFETHLNVRENWGPQSRTQKQHLWDHEAKTTWQV